MVGKKSFFLLFFLGVLVISPSMKYPLCGDLQTFVNTRYVSDPNNDGDSFLVRAGENQTTCVRLYFVDCPEMSATSKSDVERAQEQARYFGLTDPKKVIHFGRQAKEFTAKTLAQPFTFYTAYANAPGRSARGRVYAFIQTADGHDLASMLVGAGLARAYGVGRQMPDGTSRDEMIQILRDLETASMLKRVGIWAESNPDHIVELRQEQREDNKKILELKEKMQELATEKMVLDLNKAAKEELESVPGIGPVLAERIMAGRPFSRVEDLLKIDGVGKKRFEKLKPYFFVEKPEHKEK